MKMKNIRLDEKYGRKQKIYSKRTIITVSDYMDTTNTFCCTLG